MSRGMLGDVFLAFLRLGLTSFGGPVAHLGYFRTEFVERRRWLNDAAYSDIVALCQFLPGPASSQVGIVIGMLRAGLIGGLAAWLGFSGPSAVAMILFAYGVDALGDVSHVAWAHGLKIVAAAVVAQAVYAMARALWGDRARASLGVGACLLALAIPSALGQIGAILIGGVLGWRLLPRGVGATVADLPSPVGRNGAIIALALFFVALFLLPAIADATQSHTLALLASFYRSGSLVFGGAHVVLPLLQQAVVPQGWIGADRFLAGYGAAQAVPGPLFTFAAYLGASMQPQPRGWLGGILCLVAIYLPSFLLLVGALPFFSALRAKPAAEGALKGVNAAVVGILLAALYSPVFTSAIATSADFGVGVLAFLLLAVWRAPPWAVVGLGAVAEIALGAS